MPLSKGQSPPPCNALGILPVKAFPAPRWWDEKSSSPILWLLSSLWNAAHYMQCGNGGKIPPVFGKEINAPSLLPGLMEKRCAGVTKIGDSGVSDAPVNKTCLSTHKGTFLFFFVQSRSVSLQSQSSYWSVNRQKSALPRTAGTV